MVLPLVATHSTVPTSSTLSSPSTLFCRQQEPQRLPQRQLISSPEAADKDDRDSGQLQIQLSLSPTWVLFLLSNFKSFAYSSKASYSF